MISRAALSLAIILDLNVDIEGGESDAAIKLLIRAGCEQGQGQAAKNNDYYPTYISRSMLFFFAGTCHT